MKIKKILLIVPPAYTFKLSRDISPLPPMGLGYLASIVRDIGLEVRILDCLLEGWSHEETIDDKIIKVGLSNSEIEKNIREYKPDLVGLNCQFSRQHKIYHNMLSLVKSVNPECVTIAGGAHVTVCPDDILCDPYCDYIILGEAEESFKEFILTFNAGDSVQSVDGLGWKTNGINKINEKKKWVVDLDSLPFPAYDIMGLEKYFGLDAAHGYRHKDNFCPIITTRGCPAKCSFCSAHRVWGNKFRVRSVDNVIEEMYLLKIKYNVEELIFEDDNVTGNAKRAKNLFSRMVKEEFNFIWDTPNGVGAWTMDEEMIDLMKESGCVRLNFPVESGSQKIIDTVIRKPLNLEKVRSLIHHCQKIGLDYGMFLIIGLPGEKLSDMWKSFRFAASCRVYVPHISVATPYPGTQLYALSKEKGYFSRDFSLDDLFLRSFAIRTPDWNEHQLRLMLFFGNLYLRVNSFIANPRYKLMKLLKHPILTVKNIFRL